MSRFCVTLRQVKHIHIFVVPSGEDPFENNIIMEGWGTVSLIQSTFSVLGFCSITKMKYRLMCSHLSLSKQEEKETENIRV